MIHLYKWIFLFVLSCVSFSALTKPHIELIAGLNKPPFVIEENSTGIQLEVVKAAFLTHDIKVKFVHIPFGRSIMSFQRFEVDGLITVPSDYQHPGMYISNAYIRYQNVAVSLEQDNFSIENVEDLSGKNVVAFQKARNYLGEDYNNTVKNLVGYREFAEQAEQVASLFYRQSEVIILDQDIFRYLVKLNQDFNEPVVIHSIFDERYYAAGFKTKKLQQQFNSGLRKIIENGTYQAILDSYLR